MFPQYFDNPEEIEVYNERKKRLIALCSYLGGGKKEDKDTLYNCEKKLLEMFAPKNFTGAESFEITYQKNFQYLCFNLGSHTNRNVKEMNVFEVYTLLEMLKKQEKNG